MDENGYLFMDRDGDSLSSGVSKEGVFSLRERSSRVKVRLPSNYSKDKLTRAVKNQ